MEQLAKEGRFVLLILKKLLIPFFVLALVLTGCGKSNNSDINGLYNDKPQDSSTTLNESNNPFDPYELTDDKGKIIDNAVDILANKCMKKLGFINGNKFPNVSKSAGSNDVDHSSFDPTFGPLTIAYAKKWAYLVPGTFGNSVKGVMPQIFDGKKWKDFVTADPNKLDEKTGKQYDALYNKGGCEDQAYNQIYKGITKISKQKNQQVSDLESKATTNTNQEEQIVSLQSAWSNCMKNKGFSYSNFAAPQKKYGSDGMQGTYPSNSATTTAVADVECKNETNFINVYRQALQEQRQKIVDQNTVLFNESKDYVDALVAKAQEVISNNK